MEEYLLMHYLSIWFESIFLRSCVQVFLGGKNKALDWNGRVER